MRRLKQVPGATIHCCVCLNQDRSSAAVTLIKGFAVCAEHVALVSRREFDITHLTVQQGKSL